MSMLKQGFELNLHYRLHLGLTSALGYCFPSFPFCCQSTSQNLYYQKGLVIVQIQDSDWTGCQIYFPNLVQFQGEFYFLGIAAKLLAKTGSSSGYAPNPAIRLLRDVLSTQCTSPHSMLHEGVGGTRMQKPFSAQSSAAACQVPSCCSLAQEGLDVNSVRLQAEPERVLPRTTFLILYAFPQ